MASVRQHISPQTFALRNHACQYIGDWPSGSVSLKFKFTDPPVAMLLEDTVKAPAGGSPWFGFASISTIDSDDALPPRPSATEATYLANANLAYDGAVNKTGFVFRGGVGKMLFSCWA